MPARIVGLVMDKPEIRDAIKETEGNILVEWAPGQLEFEAPAHWHPEDRGRFSFDYPMLLVLHVTNHSLEVDGIDCDAIDRDLRAAYPSCNLNVYRFRDKILAQNLRK